MPYYPLFIDYERDGNEDELDLKPRDGTTLK